MRLTANAIALHVNEIIIEAETNPLFLFTNPTAGLHARMRTTHSVNSPEFMGRIQKMFTTRPSPEFPDSMSDAQVAAVMTDLKTVFLDHFQVRVESAILIATTFRNALHHTMKMVGEVAATALNKWVHGAISGALQLDLGPVEHTAVSTDAAAFLFGITYEYNSNETEYNRMSATISHYLALHLDPESHPVRNWQTLWTPTSIQAAVGLEATSVGRPWTTAMKYMVSHTDRANITNVLVLSELTYTLQADFGGLFGDATQRVAAGRMVVDLLRTHAFLHAVRITRSVQENDASPLYGYAVYPFTVGNPQAYDTWPSVCARVRKALRDREQVEALLAQMRGAAISDIEVPAGSCDTLMAEDWATGELAVVLNGDRRPEVLVRVADYERMLLHGTAENPFDRQEVRSVDVVRIRVAAGHQ
jgi:hypothetical protein